LRLQFRKRLDCFVVTIEAGGERRRDEPILAFDKGGDLLEIDDERGLKALKADLAIAFSSGERFERASDSTGERLLPLEKRREPAVDEADPRTPHARGKRRRQRVERRPAVRQVGGPNERAIERRQRLVVAPVGVQPLAIVVAHGENSTSSMVALNASAGAASRARAARRATFLDLVVRAN